MKEPDGYNPLRLSNDAQRIPLITYTNSFVPTLFLLFRVVGGRLSRSLNLQFLLEIFSNLALMEELTCGI